MWHSQVKGRFYWQLHVSASFDVPWVCTLLASHLHGIHLSFVSWIFFLKMKNGFSRNSIFLDWTLKMGTSGPNLIYKNRVLSCIGMMIIITSTWLVQFFSLTCTFSMCWEWLQYFHVIWNPKPALSVNAVFLYTKKTQQFKNKGNVSKFIYFIHGRTWARSLNYQFLEFLTQFSTSTTIKISSNKLFCVGTQ